MTTETQAPPGAGEPRDRDAEIGRLRQRIAELQLQAQARADRDGNLPPEAGPPRLWRVGLKDARFRPAQVTVRPRRDTPPAGRGLPERAFRVPEDLWHGLEPGRPFEPQNLAWEAYRAEHGLEPSDRRFFKCLVEPVGVLADSVDIPAAGPHEAVEKYKALSGVLKTDQPFTVAPADGSGPPVTFSDSRVAPPGPPAQPQEEPRP